MRDIALLMLLLFVLPLLFRSAFAAMAAWIWANLAALNLYAYGFMTAIPIVQVFAIVSLVTLFMSKPGELARPTFSGVQLLLLLFGLHVILVATFAYDGLPRNWEIATSILKNLLLCLLMPLVVHGRTRIIAIALIIALGMAMHGVVDALKFLASAGSHKAQGNAKLGDNNHLALSIVMVLPLTLFFWQFASQRIARIGAATGSILICLAVVSTQSRAGLIGLLCALLWYYAQSARRLVTGVVAVALLSGVVVYVAPDAWLERMSTIQSADEDSSFMHRVTQWKIASAVGLENPLLGGGFQSVQSIATFVRFKDEQGLLGFVESPPPDRPRAAHSIYFELIGDTGFTGLTLFLLLMSLVFLMNRQINNWVRRAERTDLDWAMVLSRAICASIFALLVAGSTLSLSYYELHFILVAFQSILREHVRMECAGHVGGANANARRSRLTAAPFATALDAAPNAPESHGALPREIGQRRTN